jgi:hypothetical protein
MNDTYFFGKRMSFNEGGRARFNVGGTGNQDAEAQGLNYISNNKYLQNDFTGSTPLDFSNISSSGIMSQAPVSSPLAFTPNVGDGDGGGGGDDDDDDNDNTDPSGRKTGKFGISTALNAFGMITNPIGMLLGKGITGLINNIKNPYKNAFGGLNKDTRDAIGREDAREDNSGQAGSGTGGVGASGPGSGGGYNEGNRCFDPSTLIQMTNGSEKKIKDIQLGDDTKGGEVTGVFQFKVNVDEIHNYKGVTVAGSHFVKEDGKFIMVKDSPLAVKIDKIPVVYSLDTTGRRIFIKDIEFADYNGDGVAKSFLSNAGVDLSGFDKEVLRQVEHRLI